MLEYFAMLEQAAKVCRATELEALARDKELPRRGTAITGESVEGYLFPDTYEFRVGEKPRGVLEPRSSPSPGDLERADQQAPRDAAKLKDKLEWSDRDILTMASIVEKEARRSRRAPAHRAGVHQPAARRRLQVEAARRPIQRSATAAWSR